MEKENKKTRVTVDLEKDFASQLRQIAKKNMLPLSAYIRLVLKEKLEEEQRKKEG